MQLVILSGPAKCGKTITLGRGRMLFSLSVFGALLAALATACFSWGVRSYVNQEQQNAAASVSLHEEGMDLVLRDEIHRGRAAVVEAREKATRQLQAIGVSLSRLQGRVLRLEALGTRLSDMAALEPGEFDWNAPVGLGGPLGAEQYSRAFGDGAIDLMAALNRLERRLQDRENKLDAIEAFLMRKTLKDRSTPAGSPVPNGWISSRYGMRTDPFTGRREFHSGIDITGKYKSPVIALASGIVTRSGRYQGYGNLVEIEHGEYRTLYAHNQKNLVRAGQLVKKHQPIALMGSTGRSTGAHVHFEVLRAGVPVNPREYILSLQ
ncbi:MAG: M23 family metallopeptidase [Gammaproteobacteria bacterium]|nr:M23 family metallopeptidase [Gammaproteobacteria bacterium]